MYFWVIVSMVLFQHITNVCLAPVDCTKSIEEIKSVLNEFRDENAILREKYDGLYSAVKKYQGNNIHRF